MTPKESAEAKETRYSWVAGAILGVLGVVAAIAAAAGIKTPAAHFAEIDAHLLAHDVKMTDHETRIQRLEDMNDTLESIAAAVGAEKKKKRHAQ